MVVVSHVKYHRGLSVVTDTLPDGMEFVGWTPAPSTVDVTGSTVPAVGSVGETLTVKLLDLTPGTTATVEVTLKYPDFVSTHDIGDLDEAFDEVMALESGQCRSRRTVEQFAAHAEPDHAPGRQLVSAYSTLLGVTE
ncbi:hypothetical protein [Streptomyces sp. NPDC014744]|uniref:hypothetical protein n=1 Tax=Streptomyces sp. NPDC014744 TaxID=3364903 RepID=UPI0036FE8E08